jgi:hypothetical protein
MKHLLSATLLAGVLGLGLTTPVSAQSDILLRLRSGSPLGDRFRVDSAGGFVAISELGIGIIPASGEGYRVMWHPFKASFRAGHAETHWDDANNGFFSWAGGNNTTASQYATFAFGDNADATANYAVAFGNAVEVSGTYGFGAGISSKCAGSACISMGNNANASGDGAIALGYRVTADANYSVALGYRASANGRTGSFTWADQSTTDSLENSANNSFQIRAAGGVRLYTNATTTTGMSLAAGGSSWVVISDRNRKQDFLSVDGEDLLARLRGVPVTTWRYRDEVDRSTLHIGPMAQDWQRAFGFSRDGTTINMSDFDGVNLAAVQALEARTAEQARRIDAQARELQTQAARMDGVQSENATLREQNRALEARLERLEAVVAAAAKP